MVLNEIKREKFDDTLSPIYSYYFKTSMLCSIEDPYLPMHGTDARKNIYEHILTDFKAELYSKIYKEPKHEVLVKIYTGLIE